MENLSIPISNPKYDLQLKEMSAQLKDLGLDPVPLTSHALTNSPNISSKVTHVIIRYVIDSIWTVAFLKRKSPAIPSLNQWISQLPTFNQGTATRGMLEADLKDAILEFFDLILTHDLSSATNSGQASPVNDRSESPSPIIPRRDLEDPTSYPPSHLSNLSANTNKSATAFNSLIPNHALPLFYIVRPIVLKHFWPKSLVHCAMASSTCSSPCSASGLVAALDAYPPPEFLNWIESDMEDILGQLFVSISIQTHLLALYGGSPELLNILCSDCSQI